MDRENSQAMEVEPEEDDGQHLQEEPSRKARRFQKMIKSRKEKKKARTEEKRKELVKIIQDRKLSNEGEANVKIMGLPNDLWEMILPHVATPQDVGSAWEAFPRFRALTNESQRKECLLAKLLSIDRLPFFWENEREKLKVLKTFRSLSKGMRNAVDQCMEEDFMKDLRGSGKLHQDPALDILLDDMRSIDEVLAKFRDGPIETRAKRVFRRTIPLEIFGWKTGRFQETRQKMISLLKIVGDQIWHFQLDVIIGVRDETSSLEKFSEYYLFMREWAVLMPNLKWLEFTIKYDGHTSSKKGSPIPKELFQNSPFPHLKDLERVKLGVFDCNVVGHQNYQVASEILRSNRHVKMLDIEESCRGSRMSEEATSGVRSLMSMLDLHALSLSVFLLYNIQEIMRYPLPDTICHLRRLDLRLHGYTRLDSLFGFLNLFPTLEHVSIESDFSYTEPDMMITLKLPNLTHFEFINAGVEDFDDYDYDHEVVINCPAAQNLVRFYSLDFLRRSKKLKTLVWSANFLVRKYQARLYRLLINHERHEEMVNFRGGYRNLTYSNIWDVFPELETIRLPDCYVHPFRQVCRNSRDKYKPYPVDTFSNRKRKWGWD